MASFLVFHGEKMLAKTNNNRRSLTDLVFPSKSRKKSRHPTTVESTNNKTIKNEKKRYLTSSNKSRSRYDDILQQCQEIHE